MTSLLSEFLVKNAKNSLFFCAKFILDKGQKIWYNGGAR